MDTPIFLTVEDVLTIHQNQIDLYGGSHGLRDMNLLESAIKAPAATFGGQFLHGDVIEMAAAYLVYLVKNHAFVDGNKRVGTAAALAFLDLNGIQIRSDEPAFSDLVLGVATDVVDKEAVVEFFRSHSEAAPS